MRKLLELLRLVGMKIIARPVRWQLNRFEAATRVPRPTQEALLRRILAHHADTDFGRAHHFRAIRTVADFRRHLPVAGYEYFEPYLERVRRGDVRALLADPVRMFALTSGTTAARKFVPVTDRYVADYRRGWNIWGLKAYRDHVATRLRPIVQMTGDGCEFRTECGIPCGAVTGLTAAAQKRIVRWVYCVPTCVGRVKDPAAKNYLVLRLSLPKAVGMVITANPSTLLNLARAGDQDKERLIRDLHDGTLDPRLDVPPDVRAELAPRLRRRYPERARTLEEVVRRTGTLYPRDYWPSHCLLGNWTGGSVGAYLRHYPRYFGGMPVRDIGLIASEGRMTIPLDDATPSGVLDVTSHYFEFVPEAEGDSPQPTVLGADEVEEGRNYYILLTTSYGLYRYHIHDLVRVTGFFNGTPLLEFLSKGANFANVTGEKLSEYQVTRAVQEVLRELDLSLTAYTLAPCWDEELPYYGLFVERGDLNGREAAPGLAEALDRRLAQANIEYAGKRESGRLGPVRLELLPAGTWLRWDRQRLARTGGAAEQYKHPCLVGDLNFRQTMPVEPAGATPGPVPLPSGGLSG
jgi:hypothetical protein